MASPNIEVQIDIYKEMLLTIIKPLAHEDFNALKGRAKWLKQAEGADYAIGETVERAVRWMEMTLSLAKDEE